MSALVTKFICSVILFFMGILVVKNISGSDRISVSKKSILFVLLLVLVTAISYSMDYNYIYSILIYILAIITYKELLNISSICATISCGIMMLTLILLDFIMSPILAMFMSIKKARGLWYFNIFLNVLFSIVLIIIFSRKKPKEKLPIFIKRVENKKAIKIVFSIIIGLISLSIILSTMGKNFSMNSVFTTNSLLFLVFSLLIFVLLDERNNYENLSDEYDSLFKYIQIFEDWIEKEQLTRHEYKNQLAVLRSLTKEKKVKDKIDSIIEDFINIDNDMITQLKSMPSGGLKGLLYYKISIAKKKGINVFIDVDETSGTILSKISDDKQKTLTKLLGIYMDNAIEAANDNKVKNISIEIYRIKEKVRIVISNTYNKDKIISNRNLKGVSTKGKGRGNGLYFASKLIDINDWILEKQELIDNYYIQNLIIKNVE